MHKEENDLRLFDKAFEYKRNDLQHFVGNYNQDNEDQLL